LDWTQQLLDITKARYDKGLASSVDLLEIESAVAERRKELIAFESSLKKSEDELKLITNLVDDPKLWNAEIVPIDQPELSVAEVSLVESLENAFLYRPDYISKNIELKSKDIEIKVAKNNVYPTVDLIGSFGLNGLGPKYREALRSVDDKEYRDWSVGIEISIPWGSGGRAGLDKKKLEKMQELLELKRLEQNIILDVRDNVRAIDIQYRQVEAAKLLEEKQRKNYEAQEKRYKAGELSTHDLLDYRFRLAMADLDYIKALIDYNVALIELDKAQGLTLVKNDVALEN
jgi:outer membrane protein TolC